MAGRGATRAQYGYKHKAFVRKFERDMQQLADSLSKDFHRLLVEEISKAWLDVGYDILFDAVTACPYESGALRNSGTMSFVVGLGGRIDPVLIVKDATPDGYFRIAQIGRPIKRLANRLDVAFSFERIDKGLDIALYTHEELLPYPPSAGSGSWHARKPGTGPKYLENAIQVHVRNVERKMEEAKSIAMKRYIAKNKNIAR